MIIKTLACNIYETYFLTRESVYIGPEQLCIKAKEAEL